MSNRIEELKNLGWDENAITELLAELLTGLKDQINGAKCENQTTQPSETLSLNSRISNFLWKIGTPSYIKGREYLEYAISYYVERKYSVARISLTKELYPLIANEFNTTASRVGRAIRYACEQTFDNRRPEMQHVFGYCMSPLNEKLSTRKFLSVIVDYINLGEDLK